MDTTWAIQVLEWWVENATAARATNSMSGSARQAYVFGYIGTDAVARLREREDQTRQVLARVNGEQTLPVLLRAISSEAVQITDGVESCRYALGRLRTESETVAKLGSNAPAMSADSLHPLIWDAASGRWASGHYSDAVQRAASSLNDQVQFRVGRRDVSDAQLMKETFSRDAPTIEKARMRWPGDDDDQTVKSMRVGILNFAQGVFSAIRNPATHSTEEIDRQEALEQLAALSILTRWIDKCEIVAV